MLPLDITDTASYQAFSSALTDTLMTNFGRERFDFLVNNAGNGLFSNFVDATEEQFGSLVAIHLRGPIFLTQKLLPLVEDGGRILNVSSSFVRFTLPGYSVYAAVKAAVEVLTRYMAVELGSRRIRENAIAPGAIATDFGGGAVRDNKDVKVWVAQGIALGRVGLPDDVGGAIAAILQTIWRGQMAQLSTFPADNYCSTTTPSPAHSTRDDRPSGKGASLNKIDFAAKLNIFLHCGPKNLLRKLNYQQQHNNLSNIPEKFALINISPT